MKSFEINGTVRENLGSKDAVNLRRKGMVPCVIYGGKENIHFYSDEREISKTLITPEVYKVIVKLGDKSYETIVRDAQFHPVTDRPLHVDFLELIANKLVDIKLPVALVGTSIGVRNGGKLKLNLRKIKVKGLPSALPDAIDVNIEKLRIGESIRVSQLTAEGVEFLEPKNSVIVSVKTSRVVAGDEEATDETEEEETAEETETAEATAE